MMMVAVCALLAVACAGSSSAEPGLAAVDAPGFAAAALTADGREHYGIVAEGSGAVLQLAGAPGDGNTRVVFWRAGATPSLDQESCATWRSLSTPVDQPGVALRIESGPPGVRALTVTRNVFGGAGYIVNVHAWDSAAAPGVPPVLARFDLGATLTRGGDLVDLPWRLCARVTGARLDVVVWPLAEARPPWGDAGHGGSTAVPPGYDAPGLAGWFAGHLGPGDRLVLADLAAP
jgi:hypothetical protein